MRILLFFICCLSLLSLSATAQTPNRTRQFGTPSKLPPEDQRLLNLALADYRNSRRDAAKRADAVSRALNYGSEGAQRLLITVTADLEPLVRRYRDNFTKRAIVETKTKLKDVKVDEVLQLRKTVLDLSAIEALTKEMIVEKADPAVARLAELLLIDRSVVLDKATDLQTQRAALAELGGYWQQCMVILYEATPEKDRPAQAPSFEDFLKREEDLAVRLAGPIDDHNRKVLAYNTQQESLLEPEEARCLLELNLLRILLGLNALANDKGLLEASRDHSKDMNEKNFFAHESPVPGKKTPWDRAKNFGTSASGENIFMGSMQGRDAHLAWFHSPGHHKNMLVKGHNRVGIGQFQRHWTQLFGG